MDGAARTEVHILGGSMVWHASADSATCMTACGGTSRQIAKVCRASLGDAFAVHLHLTPSAVGSAGGADVTGDLGPLAERLAREPDTAILVIATALCGVRSRPTERNVRKCLPNVADAPPLPDLLSRLRARPAGVVFAAATTMDPATPDERTSLAASIREASGADVLMAVDVRTGVAVVVGGPRSEGDLVTADRELAIRTLVERARAVSRATSV
jgi:hypothetical protein